MVSKKCYGLNIDISGKQEYIHEDPYNYIESLDCKPIDDYFGFLDGLSENDDEDTAPVRDPLYINSTDIEYNVLFYSKNGDINCNGSENTNAEIFCNKYMWRINDPDCTDFPAIYDNMLILSKNKKILTKKDMKTLKNYLKECTYKGEKNG